jgi:hypothetical protein
MDYKNGKIYKILNDITDDVYVGSTCQPLSKRMAEHRKSLNGATVLKSKKRLLYDKMRAVGKDHFYIELIEEYPCDNIEQLLKREGCYIREIGTLNTIVSGRTQQEYNEDNKEHLREKRAEWETKNKEHLCDYQKKYQTEHADRLRQQSKQYREDNKERIQQQRKAYREDRKKELAEKTKLWRERNIDKLKQTHTCDICGSTVQHSSKQNHCKTKKHQQALQKES